VTRSLRSLLLTAGALVPLGAGVVWAVYGPWDSVIAAGGPGAGVREIPVRVHAWGFSPRVIQVAPGQTVRFVALSEDIGHGFAINELGLNLPLRPGQPIRSPAVTVNLPEGAYEIHCSVFCGLGHPAMKARLIVGASRAAAGAAAPWLASLAAVGAAAVGVAAGTLRRRRG
jgi:cytochrome c oxidase subunit 2